MVPAAARIALTANGHAEVASAGSDIGTGTYTIMAQVAADMLGLPLENISRQAWQFLAAPGAGGRRIVDRCVCLACDRWRPLARCARSF